MRKRITGLLGCLLVLATGAMAQTVTGPRWFGQEMLFSQDGKRLVATVLHDSGGLAAKYEQAILSWDVQGGQRLSRNVQPATIRTLFSQLILSPDGKLFTRTSQIFPAGLTDNIYDTATGEVVCVLEKVDRSTGVGFAFSPDSKLLIGAEDAIRNSTGENNYYPGKVLFWDTSSGKLVQIFKDYEEYEHLEAAAFSQDNRFIALAFRDSRDWNAKRRIVVAKRENGQVVRELTVEKPLQALALSRQGKYLATVFKPEKSPPEIQTIKVWDVDSGALRKTISFIPLKSAYFESIAFTDNDELLTLSRTARSDRFPTTEFHQWSALGGSLLFSRTSKDDGEIDELPLFGAATAFSPLNDLQAHSVERNRIELRDLATNRTVRVLEID